jgi:hypothetical protein
VLTSHGQLGFQSPRHWLKKFVYLNFVNRGPIHAAGMHVLSHLAARQVKLLLPGYSRAQLVQGNLVSIPNLTALSAGSRSDYEIPQDAFVLIFPGRLDVWVKGLGLLVEALACLTTASQSRIPFGADGDSVPAALTPAGNSAFTISPQFGQHLTSARCSVPATGRSGRSNTWRLS